MVLYWFSTRWVHCQSPKTKSRHRLKECTKGDHSSLTRANSVVCGVKPAKQWSTQKCEAVFMAPSILYYLFIVFKVCVYQKRLPADFPGSLPARNPAHHARQLCFWRYTASNVQREISQPWPLNKVIHRWVWIQLLFMTVHPSIQPTFTYNVYKINELKSLDAIVKLLSHQIICITLSIYLCQPAYLPIYHPPSLHPSNIHPSMYL